LAGGTVVFVLGALLAACGGGNEAEPATTAVPRAVTEEQAREVYLREIDKVGWFYRDDPVEIELEYLPIAEAQAKTYDLGLSLYATLPGPPPYPDGLPGWFIVARGDFFDVEFPQTPGPDTRRRPAVSIAFVDLQGGFTYGMKFLDLTATATPAE